MRDNKSRLSEGMNKKVLIFDCDPGIDDAIALAFFSGVIKQNKNNYDEYYIISTWGNVPLEKTLKNSIICKKIFDIPVQIVRGKDKSIRGDVIFAEKVHGKDGLGGYSEKYFEIAKEEKITDLKFFLDNLENQSSEIEIIATGPLSSTYDILSRKRLRERIQKVVWMGGAFFEDGNITPYAEFNSYCDPEGVEILIEFAKEKKCVYFVPLDSTKKTQIKRDDFLHILETVKNKKVREFISDITENAKVLILHDPLAVFAFFFPDLVKTFTSYAEVDKKAFRGRIYSIISPNQYLEVVYDFDRENFFRSLVSSLNSI